MNRRHFSESGDGDFSLDSRLDRLTQGDLRLLIGKRVDRHPDLANEIEVHLELFRTRPGASPVDETPPAPLDAGLILRKVRATLHGARGYGAASTVTSEVRGYLEEVTERLETNDGRNALLILEAVTEGISGGFEVVDDSSGDLGSLYDDLGPPWAEAILTADLSPEERAEWARKLLKWQSEVEDYGVDAPFSAAIEAARQGWHEPSLLRAMRGDLTAQEFWNTQPAAHAEALVRARIKVLERESRFEAAFHLASAAGQVLQIAILLARMDRINAAVDFAKRELVLSSDLLALARTLYERNAKEAALTVGEHGLELDEPSAYLGLWLRDAALESGRTDLAIRAATAALRDSPDLEDYQQLQVIAGDLWPRLRDQILVDLRSSTDYIPAGTIEIYMHEGLMKDALVAVEHSYNYDLIARVVEAALPTEPLPVISICRRQAENILNRGKASHYDAAADWLARAKAAYQVAGRQAEWDSYLAELLATHRSKYKLTPMLKALGRSLRE